MMRLQAVRVPITGGLDEGCALTVPDQGVHQLVAGDDEVFGLHGLLPPGVATIDEQVALELEHVLWPDYVPFEPGH